MKKLLFIPLVFLFQISAFAAECTHYVSSTGNDTWGNSVNINNPTDPVTALANADDDDVVCFRGGSGGNYITAASPSDEEPAWTSTHSGSSGHPVTYQAFPGETPIIKITDSCGDQCNGGVIGANGDDYIVWDGFTIDGRQNNLNKEKGTQIRSSDNVTIQNCTIYSAGRDHSSTNNFSGVRVEGSNNTLVKNNTIYGFKDGVTPSHNRNGIEEYSGHDNVYENNEIYDCDAGIYLKGTGLRTVVRYNYLHNNYAAGIDIQGNDDDLIYQNLITNSPGGITVAVYGTYDNFIYNNTLYGMTSSGSSEAALKNARESDTGSGQRWWNNLVYSDNSGARWTTDSGEADFDWNYYYNINGFRYEWDLYTITQWRGLDFDENATCCSTDPEFVDTNDPPTGFKLQGGSPAEDVGRLNFDGTGGSINVGAYITGDECIGLESECSSATPSVEGVAITRLYFEDFLYERHFSRNLRH